MRRHSTGIGATTVPCGVPSRDRSVERAGACRFRWLAKDDERLPETVCGLHVLAFACLMLHRQLITAVESP